MIKTQNTCLSQQIMLNYLQHKLDRSACREVEEHLNDCPFCSDAIDGLMQDDRITEDLSILEQRTEKLLHTLSSKTTNTRPFMVWRFFRNPMTAVASVLLILAIGTYTVYSLYRNHEKQLAKNTAVLATHIEGERSPAVTDSRELPAIISPLPAEPVSKSVPSAPISKAISAQKNDIRQEKEVPAVGANSSEPTINESAPPPTEDESLSKRSEEVKPTFTPEKEESKTAAYKDLNQQSRSGMSQTQNFNLRNSPSLNYSNSRQESVASVKTLSKKQTAQASAEPEGIRLFTKGRYRRAIPYFEQAITEGAASDRDRIQYYLARCYEESGMNKKADSVFLILLQSVSYQQQAQEHFSKAAK